MLSGMLTQFFPTSFASCSPQIQAQIPRQHVHIAAWHAACHEPVCGILLAEDIKMGWVAHAERVSGEHPNYHQPIHENRATTNASVSWGDEGEPMPLAMPWGLRKSKILPRVGPPPLPWAQQIFLNLPSGPTNTRPAWGQETNFETV